MTKCRQRRGTLICCLAVLFLWIQGCGNTGETDTGSEKPYQFVIGMSQANLGEPWRVVMNREIQEEAARYPNIRIVFTDAGQDSGKQIRDIERLLQYEIDLLIISPNEAKPLTEIVSKAYKKVPVIVLDREVESQDYTLFIGADNRMIGRQAGRLAVQMLGPKGGAVLEIKGLPGSTPAMDRSEGFREVISRYSSIRIVHTMDADWLRDKAEDLLLARLPQLPHIDVIFAHNDQMALGAYRAVQALGQEGIKYVGIDGLPGPGGGRELVEDKVLQGTFVYPTGGRQAVQYAVKLLQGENGVPKRITLDSLKITSEESNRK